MKTIVDLKNIDITYITNEVQEMYPTMNQDDIVNYVEKALSQKSIRDIIVNFVCYSEHQKSEDEE